MTGMKNTLCSYNIAAFGSVCVCVCASLERVLSSLLSRHHGVPTKPVYIKTFLISQVPAYPYSCSIFQRHIFSYFLSMREGYINKDSFTDGLFFEMLHHCTFLFSIPMKTLNGIRIKLRERGDGMRG